jgi:hypothetical protein
VCHVIVTAPEHEVIQGIATPLIANLFSGDSPIRV